MVSSNVTIICVPRAVTYRTVQMVSSNVTIICVLRAVTYQSVQMVSKQCDDYLCAEGCNIPDCPDGK